jgi:biopolymer transport protein ExbB/TolQ
MTLRAAIVLIIFSLLFAFIGLNWSEFVTPTHLSTGFGIVEAPIGLIMLGVLILVVSIFMVYILYLHAAELVRTRRQLKEMEAQRKLADQSEASRITDLHDFVANQFKEQHLLDAQAMTDVTTKLQAHMDATRKLVEESGRSMSAQLGEIEDRLDKLLPPSNLPKP